MRRARREAGAVREPDLGRRPAGRVRFLPAGSRQGWRAAQEARRGRAAMGEADKQPPTGHRRAPTPRRFPLLLLLVVAEVKPGRAASPSLPPAFPEGRLSSGPQSGQNSASSALTEGRARRVRGGSSSGGSGSPGRSFRKSAEDGSWRVRSPRRTGTGGSRPDPQWAGESLPAPASPRLQSAKLAPFDGGRRLGAPKARSLRRRATRSLPRRATRKVAPSGGPPPSRAQGCPGSRAGALPGRFRKGRAHLRRRVRESGSGSTRRFCPLRRFWPAAPQRHNQSRRRRSWWPRWTGASAQ